MGFSPGGSEIAIIHNTKIHDKIGKITTSFRNHVSTCINYITSHSLHVSANIRAIIRLTSHSLHVSANIRAIIRLKQVSETWCNTRWYMVAKGGCYFTYFVIIYATGCIYPEKRPKYMYHTNYHTTLKQNTAHKPTQTIKDLLHTMNTKQKSKAIHARGLRVLRGCEMSRIPHCLDNRPTPYAGRALPPEMFQYLFLLQAK
jgi:hypothetical protein